MLRAGHLNTRASVFEVRVGEPRRRVLDFGCPATSQAARWPGFQAHDPALARCDGRYCRGVEGGPARAAEMLGREALTDAADAEMVRRHGDHRLRVEVLGLAAATFVGRGPMLQT